MFLQIQEIVSKKLERWTKTILRSHSQASSETETFNTPDLTSKSEASHSIQQQQPPNEATMPGKSNKFDYTKRGSTGAKLGEIISRDLLKKMEEMQKYNAQTDRSSASSRSRSFSSTSVSLDSQDTMIYALDLKVPGKALGDEGIRALVVGLQAAVESRAVALEDLNIAGNGITIDALATLMPTIQLSRFSLKTVDVSANSIRVKNRKEAAQWEKFLQAFESCGRLRRLDISDNVNLGAAAFEILARLHTRERPIDPIPVEGTASTHSLEDDNGKTKPSVTINFLNSTKSMQQSQYLTRRLGLRSIPYITVRNVGLEEVGAIWLSYVLADHFLPSQLIDVLNATRGDTQVGAYQQQNPSVQDGVEWLDNEDSLSKEAASLLCLAGRLRQQELINPRKSFGSLSNSADSDMRQVARPSTHREIRSNFIAASNTTTSEDLQNEIDKARLKIQRQVIFHSGTGSVQLWRAATQFVAASRAIMLLEPLRGRYIGTAQFLNSAGLWHKLRPGEDSKVFDKKPASLQAASENTPVLLGANCAKASSGDLSEPTTPKRSYAATLTATKEDRILGASLAMRESSNELVNPRAKLSNGRKTSLDSHVEHISQKFDHVILKDHSPQRFIVYQQKRIAVNTSLFRDSSLNPSHLPFHIVSRIAQATLEWTDENVLSERQKLAAVRWGLTKETLFEEMDWRKVDRSTQILKLLRAIGCLAY